MKKTFSITLMLMFSLAVSAQRDVTQFLGIPIDGSKSEMISKLKAKGFHKDPTSDALAGEFNGMDVNVYVATNNNKVYRIMVADANISNERSIQIRFNKLCEQFANSPKYLTFQDFTIPDDENIAYEISVNKKRYEAIFYQQPAELDTLAIGQKVKYILSSKYTEEQLANPTEKIQLEITELITKYLLDLYSKKVVWFMITEYYGEYYITMFYDNEYNHSNGEDL